MEGENKSGQESNPFFESNEKKQETFTLQIKKDNLWKYSTFILLAVVVVGGFFVFREGGGSTTGATAGAPTVTPPSGQVGIVSASEDDDAIWGDSDAPVTIIEFSDYQCPFCARFWSDTLPQIKSQYIDTGKVKLIYRDFPLTSIHSLAQPSAEAAECVRAEGGDDAYFEYHDEIFANQPSLSVANLKSWASDMGYDIGECLDSGEFRNEVQADARDAQASGGQGTPYFVINGKPLSGAQPFSAFQQIIESELA